MTYYIQLGLFENIKAKKRRIRYKIPTYTKFYSIWQYDRNKFKNLINERKKGLNKLTQEQILEQCYIRDEQGRKQRDCDEQHIFRIATLQKIYGVIFKKTGFEYKENAKVIYKYGLAIYQDEEQAEIKNSWQLSIKERLQIHIMLLRLIKQGMSIETAINKIKREF